MIIRFYLPASDDKSRIIKNTSKKLGVKISRIGKIRPYNQKSLLIGEKRSAFTG
jgi:thiamine-monophosphate kinase